MTNARHAGWLLSAALVMAGCGAGVETLSRPGTSATPNDAIFVQVIDAPPDTPMTQVSQSVWEVHPLDPLPARASQAVLDAMREAAGARGASHLLVERIEQPWRKAFYGSGLVAGATTPIVACDGLGYAAGVGEAASDASRCLRRLVAERPGLNGRVEVVFQVDARGEVMRAIATPDSSRDGQAQTCVIEAVAGADYGPPGGFTCRGTVAVDIEPGT